MLYLLVNWSKSMCIYPLLHYVAYSEQTGVNIVKNFPSFCMNRWCGGELFALTVSAHVTVPLRIYVTLLKTLSKCVSSQDRNGENKAPTLDAHTLIYDDHL